MRFVSIRDLRGKSAQIWRYLAKDREIILTSNGRPIAVLSAVSEGTLEESLAALRRARAMTAVEAMQSRSISGGRDRTTPEEIEAEIRAVRKSHAK